MVVVDEIPPLRLQPESSAQATISVRIALGYHVQANPASDKFLILLELKFGALDDTATVQVIHSPPASEASAGS